MAVETAAKSVRELRIAEVVRQDLTIQDGAVLNYRVRLGISFKYDPASSIPVAGRRSAQNRRPQPSA